MLRQSAAAVVVATLLGFGCSSPAKPTAPDISALQGIWNSQPPADLPAGCTDFSWSVTISTSASAPSAYTGTEVGLTAVINADNTGVWIDSEDWDVITAPGAFTLDAHGQTAEFTGLALGDYVLRYRVWYWVDVRQGLEDMPGVIAVDRSTS